MQTYEARQKVSKQKPGGPRYSVAVAKRLGGPGAGRMAACKKAPATYLTHVFSWEGPLTARYKVMTPITAQEIETIKKGRKHILGEATND